MTNLWVRELQYVPCYVVNTTSATQIKQLFIQNHPSQNECVNKQQVTLRNLSPSPPCSSSAPAWLSPPPPASAAPRSASLAPPAAVWPPQAFEFSPNSSLPPDEAFLSLLWSLKWPKCKSKCKHFPPTPVKVYQHYCWSWKTTGSGKGTTLVTLLSSSGVSWVVCSPSPAPALCSWPDGGASRTETGAVEAERLICDILAQREEREVKLDLHLPAFSLDLGRSLARGPLRLEGLD